MFKSLRAVLSHSRVPLKVDAATNANVYRVRFVKPPRQKGSVAGRLFYIVSGGAITLLLGLRALQMVSIGGQPIFIPFGFPKQEVPLKYQRTDPEVRAFIKFGSDPVRARKARKVFEDKTVEILKKSLPDQLGSQIKAIHSLLYFHYPQGPPPTYAQRGVLITYKPPDDTAPNPANRPGIIGLDFTERRLKQSQYLQRESILYPRWMFHGVSNAIRDIWADITAPQEPTEDEKIERVADLVQYGVDLSRWTLQNFKDDLNKTRMRMPPANGHVIIDGMVQVTTDNALITVDLTGSFNPEIPDQATVHRMTVRFASKLTHPKPPKSVPEIVAPSIVLSQAVLSRLKTDMEVTKAAAAKAASNVPALKDDKSKPTPLVEKCNDGNKLDAEGANSQRIVEQLVDANARTEGEPNLLKPKQGGKGDQAKDAAGEALRHKPREDPPTAVRQDIDSSPPTKPQQSPPPPRE